MLCLCLADSELSSIRLVPHPKILNRRRVGKLFRTVWTFEAKGKNPHTFEDEGEILLKVTDFNGTELGRSKAELNLPRHLEPSREEGDSGERKYDYRMSFAGPKYPLAFKLDPNRLRSTRGRELDKFWRSRSGIFTLTLIRLPKDGCGSSNSKTLAELRFR